MLEKLNTNNIKTTDDLFGGPMVPSLMPSGDEARKQQQHRLSQTQKHAERQQRPLRLKKLFN